MPAGGQEGQELPFKLNSFHLSYLLKGHFPALLDSSIQEKFFTPVEEHIYT